jgi:uncharacterized protein
MNYRYSTLFLFIVVCLLTAPASFAAEPPLPEMPSHYVVDLAGIIDDGVEQRLNGYLQELEQKTTAQVVVLTINSLEGESLEEFSITTAHDRWKLGQKGKDNGVLITVAHTDRKYRFEIGYGLEGTLPDSLVGTIGRKYLIPYFQKGDYSTGLYSATLAVVNEIAGQEGVEITGMPKINRDAYAVKSERGGGIIGKIFSILFILGAIILFITNPRLFLMLLLFSSMGGGRRGWSSGGGFGGGGFGSFGGGSGGGFGGGGASGGW